MNMELREFMEMVQRSVEAEVEGTVRIDEFNRTNGVERHGLTVIRPGCNVSPTIDLDEYYAQLGAGRSPEDVLEEIVGIYSDSRTMQPVDVSAFYEWDQAKEHVVYRLVNRRENLAMLEEVPHTEVLDMVKVYSVIQKSDDHGMMAEVQVNLEMLGAWGIDGEELERHAKENTPRVFPVSVRVLKNPSEMFGERKEEMKDTAVYLISNETGCMGAGTICYEGFLRALADQLDADLYLLAISVNEVVVIKKRDGLDIFGLLDIFKKAYRDLPKEELLSDSVYCFARGTGQIHQIGDTSSAP